MTPSPMLRSKANICQDGKATYRSLAHSSFPVSSGGASEGYFGGSYEGSSRLTESSGPQRTSKVSEVGCCHTLCIRTRVSAFVIHITFHPIYAML